MMIGESFYFQQEYFIVNITSLILNSLRILLSYAYLLPICLKFFSHIFRREEVKNLVLELAGRYRGGSLVFDSVGKFGLRLMLSKTLKNMGIKDVDGFFYINNPKKELNWSGKRCFQKDIC